MALFNKQVTFDRNKVQIKQVTKELIYIDYEIRQGKIVKRFTAQLTYMSYRGWDMYPGIFYCETRKDNGQQLRSCVITNDDIAIQLRVKTLCSEFNRYVINYVARLNKQPSWN